MTNLSPRGAFQALPPLALYIHFPWCVRKCPYCDFNSHRAEGTIPERAYVDALLLDLELSLPRVWGRRLVSVFIGGGTPSLLSPEALDRLLAGVRARLPLIAEAEVTLEANPGAVERGRFAEYRAAGINRLSLGVQSFDDHALAALGRIHSAREARDAFAAARGAGFDNINLDLMFALPGQQPGAAAADVGTAVGLAPEHISYYQLTLEPNTAFAAAPPSLPDDDAAAGIQAHGQRALAAAGYGQYEVSAYARAGRRCRHNLNYWRFGDYLGIGAGAHGKLSDAATGAVVRHWKPRHPRDYMRVGGNGWRAGERRLGPTDRVFEFMLNALRLTDGVETALFEQHTGLPLSAAEPGLSTARERGLLTLEESRLRPSELGRRYLNDLLELFLADEP